MTIVPMDQDARERIVRDVDHSLLVEAGAGTGKTTVLVDRIVQTLRSGAASADDIAVVTYTEKAAAELSTRVREGLEAALVKTTDATELERLRTARRDLYRARIETIHAFATSLLRERPVEAGVDPRFEPLDDVAAALLFDEVYEEWLGDVLSREDPKLERAMRRGLGLERLRNAAEILDAHRETLPLRAFVIPSVDLAALRTEVIRVHGELDGLRARCAKEEDRGLRQVEDVLLPYLDQLIAAEDDDQLEALLLFRFPRLRRKAGAKTNWQRPEDCDAMKELVDGFHEHADDLRSVLRAEALSDVLGLVEEFVTRHAARRRADGVTDFDDMLAWARDVLRDDLEVRQYFQQRYQAVLIDEFQDTDPIQAEIALYLTSDGQTGAAWQDLTPVPGKLVVVGDPKQSIYRFRKADIAIYDAVKGGALDGGLEQIQQNFRSAGEVLTFANRVFDRLFGDGETGVQAPHVPLEPRWPARTDDRRAAVVVVPGDGQGGSADQLREQEYALIAAVLDRGIREEGWRVRDGDTTRAATFADVAILLPRRTGLDLLRDALDARAIPFRADTPGGFFGQAEVRDLIHLLRAVDDPQDRLSTFAALRSRAFACSDEDIVLHVAAGGSLNLRAPQPEEAPDAVREALETLAGLHRERRGLSVAELVRRVLERTGMVELALDRRDGGVQGAANLLRVVERARAFQAAGGGGLRSFTRWLDERAADGDRNETEAVTLEEGDDAVRIMTIHGAKGLEFPITVLANLNAGQRQDREPIARPERHELHFQVGNKDEGFATPGYQQELDDEHALLQAERQRLLYVALTRAKDHLVIPFVAPPGEAKEMLAWLEPNLPDLSDLESVAGQDVDGVHVYDTSSFAEPDIAPVERAPKVGKRAVDQAEADLAAWAQQRSERLHQAAAELRVVTASSVEPPDRVRPLVAAADAAEEPVALELGPPLDVGNAVHFALEKVTLPGAEDLDDVVASACAEFGLHGAEEGVAQLVRNGLDSPTVKRAIASGRYAREVPFTVPHPDGDGYLAGRMDLVFEDEGGELVVVDYKTDEVSDGAMHVGQICAYRDAVMRATGRSVARVVLAFVRAGVEYESTADMN